GISLQHPSNWFVSRAVLNSNPNSGPVPEPLLVMASYRPALGGPDCGRLPSGIRRLGFVNAIAVITELPGSSGPPRPDGFSPRTSVASDRSAFCPGARQPFGSWTFRFSEAGRSFRIDVASGTGDAGEVRNVIWRI